MAVRLVVGLLMTALGVAVAARRGFWLYRLMRSGQPAPGRSDHLGERLKAQLVEVFGQSRLLRWTVPGLPTR